jgi:hypothetical protein
MMTVMELFPEPASSVPAELHVPTFDQWYARYPKKAGKAKARERWQQMSAAQKASAWLALDGWVAYAAKHPDGTKYVPMASTWLNQSRWEDDAPRVQHSRTQAPGMGTIRRVLGR